MGLGHSDKSSCGDKCVFARLALMYGRLVTFIYTYT